MEDLAVRRIHVSSDFKLPGGTSSNFQVKLSQSVNLPEGCVALLDNIVIDNTFLTVTHNHNDLLYIAEKAASGVILCRTIQLTAGNHSLVSLKDTLSTQLNNGPAFDPNGQFFFRYDSLHCYTQHK